VCNVSSNPSPESCGFIGRKRQHKSKLVNRASEDSLTRGAISVNAKGRLRLQKYQHRDEHSIVATGNAEITKGDSALTGVDDNVGIKDKNEK